MTDVYKQNMLTELTKFLNLYNEISKSNIQLTDENYDFFIRILGNYLQGTFQPNTWDQTAILLEDDQTRIDLSVFRNTKYYQPVSSFLASLKKKFYESADDEVYSYLEKTDEFDDEEKKICEQFYDKVSNLMKAMKYNIFQSTDKAIITNEHISSYEKELKEFNNFANYISSKKELNNVITRFDAKIREITKNKKSDNIFFDV